MSGPELEDLYQRTILEHNRRPRNFHALDGARSAEGSNPLCGDRVIVYLRVEDDVIADAAFEGSGCAIAKASASLMTEAVKGKRAADADLLMDEIRRMLSSSPFSPVPPLGDLAALAGVRRFPVRVKCAALAWQALHAALHGREGTVTTER